MPIIFEARRMIWLFAALAALAFMVAVAAPWFIHQLDVDRCLDAGRAYDYEGDACIGAQAGPAMSGGLVWGALFDELARMDSALFDASFVSCDATRAIAIFADDKLRGS